MSPDDSTGGTEPARPLTREEQLDRELSKGELDELPPNQVKGLLGEKNPKLKVIDSFEPDLNAGVSQEMDLPVVWMGIVLAYLIFFPLAYVLLWRTKLITHRNKIIVSAVGAAGIAYVLYRLAVG
jgi:hypothetical protein